MVDQSYICQNLPYKVIDAHGLNHDVNKKQNKKIHLANYCIVHIASNQSIIRSLPTFIIIIFPTRSYKTNLTAT